MYSFQPYKIGIVLSFAYIFSIIKNMNFLYNLSSLILTMIFTYSFMWINGSSVYHKIGLGSYILIASSFIYFINIFMKTKHEIRTAKAKKLGSGNKMIENPIDVRKNYILANYTKGLSYDVKRKSNLTVIMKKDDDDKIELGIYSKKPLLIKIKIKDIKNIKITREIIQKNKKVRTQEKDQERGTIQTFLMRYFGAFSGSDKLVDDIDFYYALETSEIYNFQINYIDNEQKEMSLEFSTKEDPRKFFSKIDNSLLT